MLAISLFFWPFPRRPNLHLIYRICLLGLLASGLVACSEQAFSKRNDRLLRFMDELYFGSPYDRHHQQSKELTRWTGPMYVAVIGENIDRHMATIERFLKQLADLTELKITIVDPEDERSNVTLNLEREELFSINEEYAICYISLDDNVPEITEGSIHISAYDLENFDSCLAHEFLHQIGIAFHSALVRSVMSPAHWADGMTDWDILAVEILFDSRLSPGQTREDVLPIVGQILAERQRLGL